MPRRAAFLLLAAALAAAPASALAADPSATDVRCMVVSGVLTQNADPQVQSVGRAGLFYFLGRLEGRGDAANLTARVSETAAGMTADDIKAQLATCNAMFTAATQSLQSLGGPASHGAAP